MVRHVFRLWVIERMRHVELIGIEVPRTGVVWVHNKTITILSVLFTIILIRRNRRIKIVGFSSSPLPIAADPRCLALSSSILCLTFIHAVIQLFHRVRLWRLWAQFTSSEEIEI